MSVIIPVYDRAHVVARAIGSVLSQTYDDFEILVVDDASSDDARAVVEGIQDRRVQYIRNEVNRGVSASRNRGIQQARGEFIAFLDSDDEWLPEKLERQVAAFLDAPLDVGLVYTGRTLVYPDGRTEELLPEADEGPPDPLLAARRVGTASVVCIRRAVLDAVGGFDESMPAGEDQDLWRRVARSYKVIAIREPLIRYHTGHADQLGANVQARLRGGAVASRKLRQEMSWWRAYRRRAARIIQFGTELVNRGDLQSARRVLLRGLARYPLNTRGWFYMLVSLAPTSARDSALSRVRRWARGRRAGVRSRDSMGRS